MGASTRTAIWTAITTTKPTQKNDVSIVSKHNIGKHVAGEFGRINSGNIHMHAAADTSINEYNPVWTKV